MWYTPRVSISMSSVALPRIDKHIASKFLSVRVTLDQKNKLQCLAEKSGKSLSTLLHEALEPFFKKQDRLAFGEGEGVDQPSTHPSSLKTSLCTLRNKTAFKFCHCTKNMKNQHSAGSGRV